MRPIHDQSCCAKLFCATQVCPFTIKSTAPYTVNHVAQHAMLRNMIDRVWAPLQLPSTKFAAEIYHPFPFTICFGLMGPSSDTFGFYNRHFLFLLLSPHWAVFTHWECVVCMVFLCPFCKIYCLWDV
jgi:hypothetical protein